MRAGATVGTVGGLPPQDTVRWIASRKASLVRAVHAGVLSADEACARYRITVDEFLVWQTRLERHGVQGLRVRAYKQVNQQHS